MVLEKQQMMAQVLGPLPTTWETQAEPNPKSLPCCPPPTLPFCCCVWSIFPGVFLCISSSVLILPIVTYLTQDVHTVKIIVYWLFCFWSGNVAYRTSLSVHTHHLYNTTFAVVQNSLLQQFLAYTNPKRQAKWTLGHISGIAFLENYYVRFKFWKAVPNCSPKKPSQFVCPSKLCKRRPV